MTARVEEKFDIDADTWYRERRHRVYSGIGFGLLFGVLPHAIGFFQLGYRVFNEIMMPLAFLIWPLAAGLLANLQMQKRRPEHIPSRGFRFKTSDMMALVAYVALLMSVQLTLVPIGTKAREYQNQSQFAIVKATEYKTKSEQGFAHAKHRADNARLLHDRKLPEVMDTEHRHDLKNLDLLVTPYLGKLANANPPEAFSLFERIRKWREDYYHRAESLERLNSDLEVKSSDFYQRLKIYYEAIAKQYEQAARHPWVPVAPDSPEPSRPWPNVTPPNQSAMPPAKDK